MYEFFGFGGAFKDLYSIQATEQDRSSHAFYFDATYDLTDRTSISAGVRHTNDEKDFYRLQYSKVAGADFMTPAQWRTFH